MVTFILTLLSAIPLIRHRLKATETKTAEQSKDIKQLESERTRLEMLILTNDNNVIAEALNKIAESLLLNAQTNAKYEAIIAGLSESTRRAHTRLDDHVVDNQHTIDALKRDFVAESTCKMTHSHCETKHRNK